MEGLTGPVVIGLIEWAVIFLIIGWAVRRARRSTVSGNPGRKTGPKWEQDKPLPECFEEDDL